MGKDGTITKGTSIKVKLGVIIVTLFFVVRYFYTEITADVNDTKADIKVHVTKADEKFDDTLKQIQELQIQNARTLTRMEATQQHIAQDTITSPAEVREAMREE